MPEKPEVITVSKSLIPKLIGKTIAACNIYWDNIIAYPSVSEFKKNIVGQTIKNISTRGKFIVLDTDKYKLLIHLRMEGKFVFRNLDDKIAKHEHVEFIIDNETSFRYCDVRKFGKMYLLDKAIADSSKPLSELGYEFDDLNLNKNYLYNSIHKKGLPIKTVLLDQSIIAGIGNIYDDEILFRSGISPLRKSCDISEAECEKIIDNTQVVLKKAIELGGTTIRTFTSSEGVHGNFQNELLVHGNNDVCPVCNSKILKIKVGGRGTYYCPRCQK